MHVIFFGKDNIRDDIEISFQEGDFEGQLEDLIETLREGTYVYLDASDMSWIEVEKINRAYGLLLRDSVEDDTSIHATCGLLTLSVNEEFFDLRHLVAKYYCGHYVNMAQMSSIPTLLELVSEVEPILAWFIPAAFCFVQAVGEHETKDGSSYMNYVNKEDFDILERRMTESEENKKEIIFQRWVKLFDKWIKETEQQKVDRFFKIIGVGE